MLQLIRLVLDDDWDQRTAAQRLLQLVRDPRVLRRMLSRVESAIAERASEMDQRAALTLRAALQSLHHDTSPSEEATSA